MENICINCLVAIWQSFILFEENINILDIIYIYVLTSICHARPDRGHANGGEEQIRRY